MTLNHSGDNVCVCVRVCTDFTHTQFKIYTVKSKGKGHLCIGTEALCRPYGPYGE